MGKGLSKFNGLKNEASKAENDIVNKKTNSTTEINNTEDSLENKIVTKAIEKNKKKITEVKIKKVVGSYSLHEETTKILSLYCDLEVISKSDIIQGLLEEWINKNKIKSKIKSALAEKLKDFE